MNELLDKYTSVNNDIQKMRNKIDILKELTEEQIKETTDENKKIIIFNKFEKQIDKIKKNTELKKKYKELNNEKNILKNKILEYGNNNISVNTTNINDNIYIVPNNELSENNNDLLLSDIYDDIDIKQLIDKYKKNIDKPISINFINNTNNINNNINKYNTTTYDDETHITNLNKLIENLKLKL
jgi:hypothetical protein